MSVRLYDMNKRPVCLPVIFFFVRATGLYTCPNRRLTSRLSVSLRLGECLLPPSTHRSLRVPCKVISRVSYFLAVVVVERMEERKKGYAPFPSTSLSLSLSMALYGQCLPLSIAERESSLSLLRIAFQMTWTVWWPTTFLGSLGAQHHHNDGGVVVVVIIIMCVCE